MCLEFLDVLRHSLAEAPSTYAKLGIVAHAVRMRLDGQASVILRDARSTKNLFSASTIQGEPSDHAVQRARRRGGATDWIVRHRNIVTVTDVDADPFRANPMLLDAGIRAYCGIPLHAGDTCLGVLYSMQEQRHTFRESEQAVMQALASASAWHLADALVSTPQRESDANNPRLVFVILTVDPSWAQVVADELRQNHGAQTLAPRDPQSAIALARLLRPAAVLLDPRFESDDIADLWVELREHWTKPTPPMWVLDSPGKNCLSRLIGATGARGVVDPRNIPELIAKITIDLAAK
jgi:hypothetical protein